MKAGHWDVPVALQDLAKMWIPNVTLPNNFLQVVEGLWISFPPLVLGILDSPFLLILFSYTIHKDNKTKSYTDPNSHFLEGELIQWQWLDKAKNVRITANQFPTKTGW